MNDWQILMIFTTAKNDNTVSVTENKVNLSDLRDDAGDDVYRAEFDLEPLLDVGGDRRTRAPRAAVTVVVQPAKKRWRVGAWGNFLNTWLCS